MRIKGLAIFAIVGAIFLGMPASAEEVRDQATRYIAAEIKLLEAAGRDAEAKYLNDGLNNLSQWFTEDELEEGAERGITKARDEAIGRASSFRQQYQTKIGTALLKGKAPLAKDALTKSAEWKAVGELITKAAIESAKWAHMNLKLDVLLKLNRAAAETDLFKKIKTDRANAEKLRKQYRTGANSLKKKVLDLVALVIAGYDAALYVNIEGKLHEVGYYRAKERYFQLGQNDYFRQWFTGDERKKGAGGLIKWAQKETHDNAAKSETWYNTHTAQTPQKAKNALAASGEWSTMGELMKLNGIESAKEKHMRTRLDLIDNRKHPRMYRKSLKGFENAKTNQITNAARHEKLKKKVISQVAEALMK